MLHRPEQVVEEVDEVEVQLQENTFYILLQENTFYIGPEQVVEEVDEVEVQLQRVIHRIKASHSCASCFCVCVCVCVSTYM